MKKVKIDVPKEDWGSLNTKYPADSDRVADNEFTAGTSNIDTNVKGNITKRKGGVTYATLPTPPKDQYEAIFSDGVRHLLTVDNGTLRYSPGSGTFTQVLTGLTATVNNEFATTQDRVYFGNGVQKKVYDRVISYGGVTYTFPTQTTKDIGAIAPSSPPTAVVAAGGSIPQPGSYRYKVTFLYYDFEESNGSAPSGVVTTSAGNQTANLTNIPIGGYGVTARKIYRDANDGVYVFVGVISNNTATTFSDTIAAGTTPIPEDNNVPPDFTLISLYLDRLFLSGIPGDPYFIFYSEPGYPDVFTSSNFIPCNQEDPITGTVVYLDRLIVFNRRSMGQILGRTSDQFRYAQIQGSVGCVDNRSIQIRVIDGVPVLIWLSDKGFYAYNGNSVVYISDKIEDQVNFNIQQSVIQKNKITQSSYTDFTAGTSSNGVNLDSAQGTITNKGPYWDTVVHPAATYDDQTNPKREYDSQTEWEDSNADKVNLATKTGNNTMQMPVEYRFDATDDSLGTKSGDMIFSSGEYKLSINTTNYTGENKTTTLNRYSPPLVGGVAYTGTSYAIPILAPRTGNITSITLSVGISGSSFVAPSWKYVIFDDINNSPSGEIWASAVFTGPYGPPIFETRTVYPNYQLTGGVKYWIGIVRADTTSFIYAPKLNSQFLNGSMLAKRNNDNTWYSVGDQTLIGMPSVSVGFIFNQNPISKNGSWVSHSVGGYDSKSKYSASLTFSGSVTSPSVWGTKVTQLILECSTDGDSFTALKTLTNPWTDSVVITGYRYYRARLFMSTTDDRETQAASNFKIVFSNTSTWTSEVIDCTSDVSSYDALVSSQAVPANTAVTYYLATSANQAGPWTGTGNADGQFGPIGSAITRRYARLKAELTRTVNTVTPSVSSIKFTYHVSSTFTSSDIDTGVTPSGWDIFQTSFNTNGGTVNFYMKSAGTQGGLAAATWYQVFNGLFPNPSLPALRWVQWKVEIVSNEDQIPTIDNVTINWFIGSSAQSLRCASIFYNTNYYLSVAEFGNTANNIVFIFDQEGKWRVYRGLSVATLSYFFNNPYYGDGVNGRIVRFLEGTDDSGSAIATDIRFKAFDFSGVEDESDKIKILEYVIVSGRNTGATYSAEFSPDEGETYYQLADNDGLTTWTVDSDNKSFRKFLRPNYTSTVPSGYSILLKITNNDTKEVEIDKFCMAAFIRKHDPKY